MKNKDSRYIEGILKTDERIITEIYTKYHKSIRNYVLSNSGNEEDALDIFQDGMEIILRNVRNKKFELTGSFYGYLFSICNKLWLRELRKRRNKPLRNEDPMEYNNVADTFDFEKEREAMERDKLFRRKFDELSENCQKVLKLNDEKVSRKDIAEQMGFKNPNVVSQIVFRCRERLMKLIKSDPLFDELSF